MIHQHSHPQSMAGKNFANADLAGKDFRGVELRGANFAGAVLRRPIQIFPKKSEQLYFDTQCFP